ncbi:MAG: peptidoglycan DD-metalloendopeptidase family protein [Spirochaetia bacterium]|nr:peptidoglycan DD-metalloendopeptidase family protein [Spirochaetia bacterium]
MNSHPNERNYDDMTRSDKYDEYNGKQKMLRFIVSSLMILIILAAVFALGWMIVNPEGSSPESEEGNNLESTAVEDNSSEIASAENAQIKDIIEESLSDTSLESESNIESPSVDGELDQSSIPAEKDSDINKSQELSEEKNDETQTDDLEKEEEEIIPGTEERNESSAEETSEDSVSYTSYTVKEGDTVSSIAESFNLLPETILGVNIIDSSGEIRRGMKLRIPDRDGQVYIIQSGDSLSEIAHSYDMGYLTLAEINDLNPSAIIYPGDELFIPKVTISDEETNAEIGNGEDEEISLGELFIWPAEGNLMTTFGEKRDPITAEIKDFYGIDISNVTGTPVIASMGGTVEEISRDVTTDNGKLIRISKGEYTTIYAHLDVILVEPGETVEQGQLIGEMGNTGKSLEPHLYFAIQRNGNSLDPLTLVKQEDKQEE